jgi:flagellar protein FlaG
MQPISPAATGSFQIEPKAQPQAQAAPRPVVADVVRPAPVAAAPAKVESSASNVALKQAIAAANQHLKQVSNDLEFAVDTSSGRTVLRVVDATTKQVIRQFPSEEVLAITRAIDRFQGLLLKEKA